MRTFKFLVQVLFAIILGGSIFGYYSYAQAEKAEITEYLSQRFQAKDIPVTEIQILELSPLRLEIIVQSAGESITPEDLKNLHKVDRELFIVAQKNGYDIKRYVRILQNSQGKQLYKLDQGAKENQSGLTNANSPGANPHDLEALVGSQINSLVAKYHLQNTKFTIEVSDIDAGQSLDIQFTTPSVEEAFSVLGFLNDQLIYPVDPLIENLNTQGGQIVVSTYEIKDDKGNILYYYLYDYQLQSGTWSSSENFPIDSEVGPAP